MTPIITVLIVIAIIAVSVFALIAFIKHKLNKVTRSYLGMGLNETADMIKKGLKEEATTPKPISNVTAIYKPRLMRDFPDMKYEEFLEMAKSSLILILGAIEDENTDKLTMVTDSLKDQVNAIINDNRGRNVVEHFDNIKIHRVAIADYKSTSESAKADFEISFQCDHFYAGNKSDSASTLCQYAAKVSLYYGRDAAEDSSSVTFSHSCPNCGAPIYSVGGKVMICQYCGSGVSQDIQKSWLTGSYKFIK